MKKETMTSIQNRLADFQSRVISGSSVYTHKIEQWRYIPIHYFSCETPLNTIDTEYLKLGESVDAWVELNGDVTLLQTIIESSSNEDPGYYAQLSSDSVFSYLQVVVPEPSITRECFERIMTKYVYLDFPNGQVFKGLGKKLQLIEAWCT